MEQEDMIRARLRAQEAGDGDGRDNLRVGNRAGVGPTASVAAGESLRPTRRVVTWNRAKKAAQASGNRAAQAMAPDEMPTGMPSSWLICFETGPESVSFTRITSS